jgi:hypothetical protein
MTEFTVLEPAIDPNNRISFLLDWEVTLKCNLDCNYCASGLYGGHDNSINHPPKQECLATLDFMFAYADLYMKTKPQGIRYVILNVYGGESLHHPDIVEILGQIKNKYQPYADHWHLTVTTTTNAIVSEKKLKQIIPYIDEFTVSYHAQNTNKHKEQFKNNLLNIAKSGKRQKCVVMMDPDHFLDCQDMITWLNDNHIKFFPKQLDGSRGSGSTQRIYKRNQVQWFADFYKTKTTGNSLKILDAAEDSHLDNIGRACCGGRQFCTNQEYGQRQIYVENKFPDWYCSVNHFFLFIKQVTGEIFVNKDCKMKFDGTVGPIGNLNNAQSILSELKFQLENNSLPIIQCKKYKCVCGMCAPKAQNVDTYKSIMKKYQTIHNT